MTRRCLLLEPIAITARLSSVIIGERNVDQEKENPVLVLAVTWLAKEGKEDRAVQLFRELSEASRKEPGCLMFVAHRGIENPSQFFIYEQYRDQLALEAHRAAAYFKKIARGELLEYAERKEGILYTSLE